MPLPALEHGGREGVGEHQRGADVHLECAVDLLRGEGRERPRGRQRSVGDQDVNPSGLLDQVIDVRANTQVSGDRPGAER